MDTFEYWMEREKYYARLERDWVAAKYFDRADICHDLRWRCMELAVACSEKEKEEKSQ